MRKFTMIVSVAVAVLLGLVSAQGTPAATASPTTTQQSAWGTGVPSIASPAAQAKVNQKIASQFGINTTQFGGWAS